MASSFTGGKYTPPAPTCRWPPTKNVIPVCGRQSHTSQPVRAYVRRTPLSRPSSKDFPAIRCHPASPRAGLRPPFASRRRYRLPNTQAYRSDAAKHGRSREACPYAHAKRQEAIPEVGFASARRARRTPVPPAFAVRQSKGSRPEIHCRSSAHSRAEPTNGVAKLRVPCSWRSGRCRS
jgi:hypothetical protein